MTDLKTRIQDILKAFPDGPLIKTAGNLLNVLGYRSDKTFSLRPNDYKGFADYFLQRSNAFDTLRARTAEWQSVDILFQLTEDELKTQHTLFEIREVDNRIIESYLFFAVALTGDSYTRGDLVRITREINKLTPMPAMVLFAYNGRLTIAVIDRRPNKNERSRDVLEKVTLIKDIDCARPHRAHVEILHDLALDELRRRHDFTNFVELHRAWQKTLDITELNRRFFKEIADWYFWAVKKVRYPNPHNLSEQHNHSLNVIRLLTRLIFCWFLKEKKLIPESLFDFKELSKILAKPPLDRGNGDPTIYYKAILQNLFFATLNTDMNKDIPGSRRFISGKKSTAGVSEEYSVPTVFRYKDLFREKENAIKYFEDIPFLNGGLFECLDTFETIRGKNMETRIDGFSSTFSKQPVVPDELFFTEDTRVDLSGDYGNPKYSDVRVRGLIRVLENYKFTIEENTPVEEEIALDPELLGKVFENLLANFNPETQTTARKQTGSFYTPREIVNYMVDESLLRYLEDRLMEFHETGKGSSFQSISSVKRGQRTRKERSAVHVKLRHLLSYGESGHLFKHEKGEDTAEVNVLIEAINICKILDLACGSGAFPMGALHKMVLILGKLDPFNRQWKQAQLDKTTRDRQRAERMEDDEIRRLTLENIEQRVRAIEEAFGSDRHELDYTRKLFLIENCIYGVDIQNIAVQIAKLRFFISLVVDQKVMDDRPNRNILALPNLETKFVAANTLIGIDKPQQELELGGGKVYAIENELKNLRQKLFYTRKYADKKRLRETEKAKREELQKALIGSHYTPASASMIAGWNPFDPVHAAGFFDMETMFNLQEGFDIVIGNPPYIGFHGFKEEKEYLKDHYVSAKGKFDYYLPFIEKGLALTEAGGILCYICPTNFMKRDHGYELRKFLRKSIQILEVCDFQDVPMFEGVLNYTGIFIFKKKTPSDGDKIHYKQRSIHDDGFLTYQSTLKDDAWVFQSGLAQKIWERLGGSGISPLQDIAIAISEGIVTGQNAVYLLSYIEAESLGLEKEVIRPCLRGKNIRRYYFNKPTEVVIYPYKLDDDHTRPFSEHEIKKYKNIWTYLNKRRSDLAGRSYFEASSKKWFELWCQRDMRLLATKKIVVPEISESSRFAMAGETEFYGDTVCGITMNPNIQENTEYILGVLNSKLIEFYYKKMTVPKANQFYIYKTMFLKNIPIRRINFSLEPEKLLHDRIAEVVTQIIQHKKQNPDAFTLPLEAQIDGLVAHLYGLSEEEFSLVLSQLSLPDPERVAAANAYRDVERGFIK